MKLKITALILALVMLLSLSACGQAAKTEETDPPEETAAPEQSEETGEETVTPDIEIPQPDPKYAAAYEKHSPDELVMTVNGLDVRWSDYYYWIYNAAKQLEESYDIASWTDKIDDIYTYDDVAKTYAEQVVAEYWVILARAQETGTEMTEQDRDYYNAILQQDIDSYAGGDPELFKQYLASMFISPELYEKMMTSSQLYARMYIDTFGETGELLGDGDALAFAEDQGYCRAKHILYMTQDDTGAALSDEDKAAVYAAAQAALDKLSSVTDEQARLESFDTLMAEESQDPGSAYYPDGYYFVPGDMVTEFDSAARALAENEISGIVESSYGYHIILRLPLDLDADVGTGYTLRSMAAASLYSGMADEWFTDAEITYAPAFEDFSLDSLFHE